MDNSVKNANRAHFWTSDSRVKSVVENVADGIIGIDTSGYIELFNPAAERLFGYTAAEVIGRNIKMLMPPAIRDHHDGYLARYSKTGERHIIAKGREVEGLRKDGTNFPMYLSVGEISVSGFRGFVGIVHDLSAQKIAAQRIENASKFLQAIIDSMSSTLVAIDYAGTITHWNRTATQERGIDSSQAIGKSFVEIFPRLGISIQDLQRTISEKLPFRQERLSIVLRGQTRYVDLVVFPLPNAFNGAVIRLDDVTERVRMEEIMVQTEKMMSVGGLAAGMAHEINNPLGVIAQGCQNLKRRLSLNLEKNFSTAQQLGLDLNRMQEYFESRDVFRFITDIQTSADRASSIINKMLAYSRRSVSSFAPVAVGELIKTALHLASHDYDLRCNYDFRHIKITREGDESVLLCCDKMAVEQVLLNLLRNSAQAMKTNCAQVAPEICVRVTSDDMSVQIVVSDNGPGMTETVSRHSFEPFFTTKPVGIGTGLGLSVAYFIITQQHRGTLQLATSPGKGAHFTIRLPKDGTPYASDSPSCR